jgi:hypothetical protein
MTVTKSILLLNVRLPRRHKHASKQKTLNKAPRNDGNEKHPPFKCASLPFLLQIRNDLYGLIFSKLAFMATTTVLMLIKTAPAAGLNRIPWLYKTPAANGRATTL